MVRSALALVGFLAASLAVAVIGSTISAPAFGEWYSDLAKPMWTPPNAIFGPVWTVLYTTMAVAGWLVWRQAASPARRRALTIYGVQLALNGLWSPVFFGLGSMMGASGLWIALGIIVALDFAILATIIRFADVSKPAAALLIPYWFWALFATTLNAAIAVLAA
jgi:tryptophan-rich sensory protein